MKWYYANGGQQSGPVEEAEFYSLVQAGVVRDETLVWHEGLANWERFDTIRGASFAPPAPSTWTASGAGQSAAMGSGAVYSPHVGRWHYAGFWARFVARIIDGILLSIIQFLLVFPILIALGIGGTLGRGGGFTPALALAQGISFLIGIAVHVVYEVFFLSTRGATPGKMVLGLKVIRSDGGPISPALALARYLAYWVSVLTLMIGFIMAAFDSQKRALHDRICNTRVVHAAG